MTTYHKTRGSAHKWSSERRGWFRKLPRWWETYRWEATDNPEYVRDDPWGWNAPQIAPTRPQTLAEVNEPGWDKVWDVDGPPRAP